MQHLAHFGSSGGGSWVRLVRAGDDITAFNSVDGTNWVEIATVSVPMGQVALIGMAHCSNTHQRASTAVFDNVEMMGTLVDDSPTLNALAAPAAPTVSATTSYGIDLGWDAVSGSTGYTVELSADGRAFTEIAVVPAPATTHALEDLVDGRMYSLRVRANDARGVCEASAVVRATTRPGEVLDLRVISLGSDTIALDWEEPFGETGYRIERSLDGVEYTMVGNAVQHGRKFVDHGANTSLRYFYRVVTLDEQGDAASTVIRRPADPKLDDVDADGWKDLVEIRLGFDAADAASFPPRSSFKIRLHIWDHVRARQFPSEECSYPPKNVVFGVSGLKIV